MPQGALERLLSLGGELQTRPGEPRRKFDLDHMRRLLGALGEPQTRFPSVLIAGTNGKGSTAATLASILVQAGLRVGLYTSPHLVRVNERIRLSTAPGELRPVEDAALFAHLAKVEEAAAGLVKAGSLPAAPSFFETLTAIAMLAFAAEGVEIAVLEVGMGGRLDATNVVEPLVSVITDISLDHTEWLGETISEIAREKAGILRRNAVLVTLPQHPEANRVIGEVAVPLGVSAWNAAEFLPGRELDSTSNDYRLALGPEWGGRELHVQTPLAGSHQRRNVALAITAALALRRHHGYVIEPEQIEAGIAKTRWPGRLERFEAEPGRPEVLLDVAHNPAGAWTLRAALGTLPAGPRHLIFGCMRDKAVREMTQVLFPPFDHVWLVELRSPRAALLGELTEAAEASGVAWSAAHAASEALREASDVLAATPGALLVGAGSVILVGELRAVLAGEPAAVEIP